MTTTEEAQRETIFAWMAVAGILATAITIDWIRRKRRR